MAQSDRVWLLCVAGQVPPFYVTGVFSSRAMALERLQALPRDNHYQLFEAPIDEFFGYFDKTGRLQNGMGNLWHEHFGADDDE